MKTFFLISFIGLFLSTQIVSSEEILNTSVVLILSNPDKYHGKKVRVSGYLHNQFEDSCLYLSKEDADYLNGKQSFWITYSGNVTKEPNQSLNKFDSKRVLIEGIFNKNESGHMGAAAGGIDEVTRVMEETQWFDGSKKLKK